MADTCTIVVGSQGERCGASPVVVQLAGGKFGECAEHAIDLHIEKPKLFVGALVSVRKYGKVYEGGVVSVTPTRVEVRFVQTNGRARVQFFPIDEVLV